MEPDDVEEVLDIEDERVPQVVRQHGRRFRKPAKWVIDVGAGEYVLFSEDGEVLDLVIVR
jgi:hypothetical protein